MKLRLGGGSLVDTPSSSNSASMFLDSSSENKYISSSLPSSALLRLQFLHLHYLLLPSVALVVLLCLLDEMNETNEGGGVKKVQTNTFRLHYLHLHYLRLHYLRPHYLLLPSVALVVLLCVLDEKNETNEGGGVKKVQTNIFRLHYLRLHYLRLHYLRPHYLLLPSVALVVLLCVLDKMNETNEGGGVKKEYPLLLWCYFACWTR